jgi:CRISPR/Cas system endoribonuclease Cas6 (RAMP superfamily)
MKRALDEVINHPDYEGQKLRAHVMEYHDIKFKAQMKRVLDNVYHQIHHETNSDNHECSDCQ